MATPLLVGPHDLPDATYDVVGLALRDFYRRSQRLVDGLMAGQGASYARSRVLLELARAGPSRSTDLAATFGYAPRTLTETIDGLERDGLVCRTPDPDDRRAKRVTLTEAGITIGHAAEASRLRFLRNVFGILSDAECAEVTRIVGKLNARLEKLGG